MKKPLLLLVLMQLGVINNKMSAQDYSFDEGVGARNALNYLPDGLTGKGVLVGVIDWGIDFNHINFFDPNTLQTRAKYACSIFKDKYIEARTPEDIAKLIPYNDGEHGTHVAGIAAGSYGADGWHGIAPEASLLLVDMDLKKDAILNSLKNIFAAADSLKMPLVLNMSIAPSQSGMVSSDFEDGYQPYNLLCEELTDNGTKPGRIIVVSSGNSGTRLQTYSEATIGEEGKVRLIIEPTPNVSTPDCYNFDFEFEALKEESLDFRFFLYDTIAMKEVTTGMKDFTGISLDFNSVAKECLYFEKDDPNIYTSYQIMSQMYFFDKDIVPCIEIIGTVGTKLRFIRHVISTDDDYFTPTQLLPYGYPSGFALTPAVISVGNYDPHNEGWPLRASSSYGVNKEGGKIPDVVAPGCGILSSGRYYDPDDQKHQSGQREVKMADGSTQAFNWLVMTGTSQSAPIVAGLCALMLEYDPTLTVNRVRELLLSTNDWTDACDTAPSGPDQAGNGILNVSALFEALMGGVTSIENLHDADDTLNRKAAKYFNGDGFVIEHAGRKYNVTGIRIE